MSHFDRSAAERLAANPSSCAYIASFGIDPLKIPEDGWDADGYEELGEARPIERPLPRRDWPDGFDYQHLLRLWYADAPTRRRATGDAS